MDAFAISLAGGAILKRPRIQQALVIAMFFGLFQAIMPLFGWLAGYKLSALICGVDHWIAFGLLCLIGGKMMIDAVKETEKIKTFNPVQLSTLFMLSIATSIDAAAVGLSFACLEVAIVKPAVIIGVVTFIISYAGVYLGVFVGKLFGRRVEFVGGLLLIGIGVKILIDHMS